MNPLSVFDLPPAEKLQLVEDLWDNLAASPGDVPVADWHKQELDRRRAAIENAPDSGLAWEEVRRRARARHGR